MMPGLTPPPLIAPPWPEGTPLLRPGLADAGARPMLGEAAVTAPARGTSLRQDPDAAARHGPADPPPVKGLGVPPLNTRRVGDGDALPALLPPRGTHGAAALLRLDRLPAQRLDLRL